MTTSLICLSPRIGLTLIVATVAALAGCVPTQPAPIAADKPAEVKVGIAAPLSRTIDDFSAELRCMDTLLVDYGTRDLEVIVEDFAEPAPRVEPSTKDLLISIVSAMTQGSRAIRIVAADKDGRNTPENLSQVPKRDPSDAEPQYVLRGSISRVAVAGAQTHPKPGAVESDHPSILTIDIAILARRDLGGAPGIATRNSAVPLSDGKAQIRKFGVTFGLSTGSNEGAGQVMRALLELASIEAFGRLAKVPYWTCLGATDMHEEVANALQGWYDAMNANPAAIITFFQMQMRTRRLYDGPIDGAFNPQLEETVARYREALGLSREAKLSLDFFKAYLGANHHQVEAKLGAAPVIAIALKPSDGTPLTLRIASVNGASRFAPGEVIQLTIRPNRDAHVYCFLQDENRKITRFFPNRFRPDSRVQSAEGLQLPGAMRFEISMNRVGMIETVSCMSTEHDVLQALPASIGKGDFVALPVTTLEQLRRVFVNVAGGSFAQEDFQFRPKSERD